MQRVTEVHRDVPGLGLRATTGSPAVSSAPGSARGPRVGARDHLELARAGVGGIELDADVEHRALDGVPAHPAVTVPGQVRETGRGTRNLDDHAVAVEPVGSVA